MKGPNLIILAAGISSRMKRSQPGATGVAESLLKDAEHRSKSLIRVGHAERPFLDYVLANARDAGYSDIVLVIGQSDSLMREYYGLLDRGNDFYGLKISYAIQPIPKGRTRPSGTADATVWGMRSRPDWKGSHVTVCNSDNLYSVEVFRRLLADTHPVELPAYDRDGLEFERERVERFSVLEQDREGYLTSIVEKPDGATIERVRRRTGRVEVSMNIFRFAYDRALPYLTSTETHPERDEKEIPTALTAMVKDDPRSVHCFSVSEHVPDLTSKDDIVSVRRYLQQHYDGPPFG